MISQLYAQKYNERLTIQDYNKFYREEQYRNKYCEYFVNARKYITHLQLYICVNIQDDNTHINLIS